MILQLIYGELICRSSSQFKDFQWLKDTDGVVWIYGFVGVPFVSIALSELLKRNELKAYNKNLRRLRLLFEDEAWNVLSTVGMIGVR